MNVLGQKCIAPFVTVVVLAAVAYGQDSTGAITGTVTDPAKALVPGAVVSATQTEQGITRSTRTNDRGIYEFKFLPIGRYEVTATLPGFKKAVQADLILATGQTMRVDLGMEVGDITQSVEVTATASQALKVETSEVSQVINHVQVMDLPLNGRDFTDLITLNAGVTDGGQGVSNGGYNLNGSRSDQNMFLIDGQSNVDINNNLLIKPSLGSVEAFQIQTGTFSAEYGRTAGGVVSLQLKSGTNQYHGSVFEFLRNDKLDANNFFDNQVPLQAGQTQAPHAPLKRNQYGGSIGGPIKKDKLFFFGDYQGTREVLGRSTIQSVPTVLERQGDFSQTLKPGQILTQNATKTPFPGCDMANLITCQKIPAQFLDPVAVKIANLYSLPNQPGKFIPGQGTLNNFSTTGSTAINSDQFDIKLDNQASTKDSISGHDTFTQSNTFIPAAYGPLGPCIGCRATLDLLAGSNGGRSQAAGISETHTFSPLVVNQFRIGVTRGSSLYQTSDGGTKLAEQIGLKNVNVSPLTTGLPWFNFSPSPSWIGTSPFTPAVDGYTDWQVSDSVSFLRGRHRMKAGYEMHRRADNSNGNFFGKGAYIFSPFFTGNAFADFMSGRPLVIQQDLTPGTTGFRGQEYGFYIQDDFKVSSRLTLNLGLRYDIFPGFTEVHDRYSNLDPVKSVVMLAGKNGTSRNFINTDWKEVGPRIGFAYALNSRNNTVLRGGYGVSYTNSNRTAKYAGLNAPYTSSFSLTNLNSSTRDSIVHISEGLPVQYIQTPANFDVNHPSGSYRQIDANQRMPYVQSFSLNIQRALPSSVVLEVGYVGAKGTRLPGETAGDPTPPGDPNTVAQRRIYSATVPNVTGITYFINGFSSIYHSVQVKGEKRFSHGLQFLTTYTYGKSIDDRSGSAVTGGSQSNPNALPMNPFNFRADRGLSFFDRRHKLVAAFNYNLPLGRGKAVGANWNRVADGILGGWQINGILTVQSGLPFNVFATSSAQCGCSATDMRPNRIADGRLPSSEQNPNHWFDSTAFTDPAPMTYGNAGRDVIPGPNSRNLDFSLFKKFTLGERRQLQIRGEYFNITNHANFLYPTTVANATWNTGGILTAAKDPRIGQVALKLLF